MNRNFDWNRLLCGIWLATLPAAAATYHLAPTGDDAAAGSATAPWRSLQRAVDHARPGDTILLHDGTYRFAATIQLTNSGTADAPLRLQAAPGAKPVLCWEGWWPEDEKVRFLSRGLFLGGNHWHLKGLEICHAPDNGLKIEGSHNVIEQCVFHHNGDSGLQIGLYKKAQNDGSLAASNLVLHCDSYRNFDPKTKGENADGFACKLFPGPGNRFVGCRAWENADDGWDLYMTTFAVTIEQCWAWRNGDPKLFPELSSYSGDGNGFKLGGQNQPASHLVRHCIAFDHPFGSGNGFEDNNNSAPITVQHCLAWGNKTNFEFKKQAHVLENNIAFAPVSARQDADLGEQVVSRGNSWQPDPKKPKKWLSTASAADFLSLDPALAAAPRQPDGRLPVNDFARLKPGSALVDRGVEVGLPFHGAAPDPGPFEAAP
jgi:hypothetical protein